MELTFKEDRSGVRKDRAPANLVVLHHMTVDLLKQEKTVKGCAMAKRLQAGCDKASLLKVLSG